MAKTLTPFMLGNLHTFLSSSEFFQHGLLQIYTIRVTNCLDPDQTDTLSDLIWVKTVCKGYQQMTTEGKKRYIIVFEILEYLP